MSDLNDKSAVENAQNAINYLVACIHVHADKFPAPSHIKLLADRVKREFEALTKPQPEERVWPKPGDRMVFLNRNGYEPERARAANTFDVDKQYTVKKFDLGNSTSYIEFEEFPGNRWNSVMFDYDKDPEDTKVAELTQKLERATEALGRIASNGFGHPARTIDPTGRDKELWTIMQYAHDTYRTLNSGASQNG